MNELELVARFLRSQSTLALATADADGAPCVAPLFYLPEEDGVRLYWLSSRSSQHSRNLAREPGSAVSIYRATAEWRKIRGVQMRGQAVPVEARSERRAVTVRYVERFHLGTLFGLAISRSRLYRFEPRWLRYVDNSRRFGYKFELELPVTRAT